MLSKEWDTKTNKKYWSERFGTHKTGTEILILTNEKTILRIFSMGFNKN